MVEINGKLFDWDSKKNLISIEKHGVPFKMAASSFFDPKAVSIDDIAHPQDEDRFILIDDAAILNGTPCFSMLMRFFFESQSKSLPLISTISYPLSYSKVLPGFRICHTTQ